VGRGRTCVRGRHLLQRTHNLLAVGTARVGHGLSVWTGIGRFEVDAASGNAGNPCFS
jgi:hypothetical protein